MENEYEATYLNIDVEELRKNISTLGGSQVHAKQLFTRYVLENEKLRKARAWLRVRTEGSTTTMTLKQTLGKDDINTTKEIEIEVSDAQKAVRMLEFLGLEKKRYQENYREKWKLDNVTLDIDTWPHIPSYVEIEGPDEESVITTSKKLGFNYKEARFGSVDEIYKNEYNIDILSRNELIFPSNS